MLNGNYHGTDPLVSHEQLVSLIAIFDGSEMLHEMPRASRVFIALSEHQ